jgi:ATP-dependent DNA helicase RecG
VDERQISLEEAFELIERDESHFWDQKSKLSPGATIQKIACALANADGGEFAVGIEDRLNASGIDRWDAFPTIEDANKVLEAVVRDSEPAVPYSVDWLRIDGHSDRGVVVLVTVGKSEDVHRVANGSVWIRRGTSSVELAGSAITDLALAKGAKSYEDQLVADYTMADLVQEPELLTFLHGYSPRTAPEDFVGKQRLVHRESQQARVSAAVLYAEVPSAVVPKRCGVKVARYETKDEEPRREHLAGTPLSLEGPARLLIDETLTAVAQMIESVSVLRPDGTTGPVQYPPDVLKEIIVNAVLHRDYNVADDILVFVFDNRVDVHSPGVLPGHMTLANLLDERFARNPTIVRLVNKYPDPPNKDIGEGLRTVVSKMAEAKLETPKFNIRGNYFVVRLGHTPLARPQAIVMKYLDTHSEITNSTGRSLTGISSENTMKEVFYSLRKLGEIEMVPTRRGSKSAWRKVDKTTKATAPGAPPVARRGRRQRRRP